MEKIRILVVEDEFIVSQTICNSLEEIGYEVVGQAFDAEEARSMLAEEQPDMALLDITLRGKEDGIQLAKFIQEQYGIPFIFLTSHADPGTLARAKEVQPPGYLLKPFQKNELFVAIEIAFHNYAQGKIGEPKRVPSVREQEEEEEEDGGAFRSGSNLFVRYNQGYRKIALSEILYLKSDRIYVEIFCRNEKPLLVRESLQRFEDKLGNEFFRIHRSYLISLSALDSFDSNSVFVNGEELPLSKNNRDDLLKRLRHT